MLQNLCMEDYTLPRCFQLSCSMLAVCISMMNSFALANFYLLTLRTTLSTLWCVNRYRDFKTCLHSIKELRAKDPDQTKLAEYGKQAAGSLMQVTRFIPCAMSLSIHNIFNSSPPHAHIESCCIWCIILHMYSWMSNRIFWHHCVFLGIICPVEVTHVLHMFRHVQLLKPQVTPQRFWLPLLRDAVWCLWPANISIPVMFKQMLFWCMNPTLIQEYVSLLLFSLYNCIDWRISV